MIDGSILCKSIQGKNCMNAVGINVPKNKSNAWILLPIHSDRNYSRRNASLARQLPKFCTVMSIYGVRASTDP